MNTCIKYCLVNTLIQYYQYRMCIHHANRPYIPLHTHGIHIQSFSMQKTPKNDNYSIMFTLLQSQSDDESLKQDDSAEAKEGDEANPPESKTVSFSLHQRGFTNSPQS